MGHYFTVLVRGRERERERNAELEQSMANKVRMITWKI